MSVISNVKDLISSVDEFSKRGFFIWKIAKGIRIISAIVILLIMFLNYSNIMEFVSWNTIPLWNEQIRQFLSDHMVGCMCFWGLYRLFIEKIIKKIIIHIDNSKDAVLLPIWFTLDDCIDMFFSIYFLLCGINLLIEFCHGYNDWILYKKVYGGAILYIVSVFWEWLYIKNCNMWYYIRREYTEFYDSEGKRIPRDAYVVYYGKRYQVYRSSDVVGLNNNMGTEWRISTCVADGDDLLLEDAVKDKEGGLVLDKWKLGATDES